MPKIKNELYLDFLKGGNIRLLTQEHLEKVLTNIHLRERKHKEIKKLAFTILYYTGCRPAELLLMQSKDITCNKSYVIIRLKTVKKGLPRTIYITKKNLYAKWIYDHASKIYPDYFLFSVLANAGKKPTDMMRYYFKRWTTGVLDPIGFTPYYVRHNRFSSMAMQGATMTDILLAKGGKSLNSVTPYVHLSASMAQKNARYIK